MSYRVIQRFVDLQDNKHRYEVGDEFPRLNANVSQERIAELASNKNRRKMPLIEEIPEFMNEPVEVEPEEQAVKPKKRKGRKNNADTT